MHVFIERYTKDEDIKFFQHKYRLNSRSISIEECLIMRNLKIGASGVCTLPWCEYADDLILFMIDLVGLQKDTKILEEIFVSFGLSINELKTETMILITNTYKVKSILALL